MNFLSHRVIDDSADSDSNKDTPPLTLGTLVASLDKSILQVCVGIGRSCPSHGHMKRKELESIFLFTSTHTCNYASTLLCLVNVLFRTQLGRFVTGSPCWKRCCNSKWPSLATVRMSVTSSKRRR